MAVFLGIDPGLATIGFGVVEEKGDAYRFVDAGVIKTPASLPLHERLLIIKNDVQSLLRQFKPQAVGVEELFFAKNVTNAIKVSHARGVILEQIASEKLLLFEFTPLQVKNNICGYGQADKLQMQTMIKKLLHLNVIPRSDDAADALAMALCAGRAFGKT